MGVPSLLNGEEELSPLSAAWGRQVPIESARQEPYNHSFFNRTFFHGVSEKVHKDCHSDYSMFTVDFCLLVLTVKA